MKQMKYSVRHSIDQLVGFGTQLFESAGMDAEKAQKVAQLLVLSDAIGRRTHGLALVPLYLSELSSGGMRPTGDFEIISDRRAALVLDGHRLPGLWLVDKAINLAAARIRDCGVVTVAIRHSHHIGCLAALARQATERGLVITLASSEPSAKRAAPYGGKEALFTPNPFAFGYPGKSHPILIDISATITTVSMTRTLFAANKHFEHPWLLDGDGRPTSNPAVLEHTEPRGSLQLLGGKEYGHKGFGLAVMIEALSQGLSGQGRVDRPQRWGACNVFLQVMDPDFFSGTKEFERQTGFFAEQCRSNPPVDPAIPVRMPGDQAEKSYMDAQKNGISYDMSVWKGLTSAAQRLGINCSTFDINSAA
ncbi:Ldh family oxidoreductase [Advenella kashmirensis]